eukprot:11391740-Karenia_brevis.AAC.1
MKSYKTSRPPGRTPGASCRSGSRGTVGQTSGPFSPPHNPGPTEAAFSGHINSMFKLSARPNYRPLIAQHTGPTWGLLPELLDAALALRGTLTPGAPCAP